MYTKISENYIGAQLVSASVALVRKQSRKFDREPKIPPRASKLTVLGFGLLGAAAIGSESVLW